MNKEKLIKELLQHDLNLFRFSVWARFNEEGDMEYAICLLGEKPSNYHIHLCKIGGNPDAQYTYDYIEFVIDDAIDEFYDVEIIGNRLLFTTGEDVMNLSIKEAINFIKLF